MNCASTSCQTATALSGSSFAALPRVPGSPLQNLPSFLKLIGGWWAQRLETQPARPLITLDDLSDHVLRDIGYLDSVPLRKHTHRTKDY